MVQRQLSALQKQARRGNTRAARTARVLEESGLFNPSQNFETVMEGWSPSSWTLGGFHWGTLGLLAATAVLAVKKRFVLAAIPAAAVVVDQGHQKGWW